jgi:hypothetical protein
MLILFLSLDSFFACAALGMLGLSARRRRALCLAFGAWDAAATFVGLKFHPAVPALFESPLAVAGMLCAWALFVGLAVRRVALGKTLAMVELSLLPVVFSVDNLFAGPEFSGLAGMGVAAPLAAGIASATFALLGYQAGTFASSRVPRPWVLGVGSGLLLLLPVIS